MRWTRGERAIKTWLFLTEMVFIILVFYIDRIRLVVDSFCDCRLSYGLGVLGTADSWAYIGGSFTYSLDEISSLSNLSASLGNDVLDICHYQRQQQCCRPKIPELSFIRSPYCLVEMN